MGIESIIAIRFVMLIMVNGSVEDDRVEICICLVRSDAIYDSGRFFVVRQLCPHSTSINRTRVKLDTLFNVRIVSVGATFGHPSR